ncbi:hypothetical protein ACH347_37760 [Saccharopolyspora sp. 5N102]|uniref:hypothetical protein n=1 Tax=Saccharopolyspora sp. 5N102 TaxID=3375155 RepID=UPI0037A7A1B4
MFAVGVSIVEVVVPPAVASAAEPKQRDPRENPLLPGQSTPERTSPGRTNADFASLTARAGYAGSRFDPVRSKPVSRSMFVEEWANPDGTRTVRQSTVPLNVKDAAGQWQPVDTTLVPGQRSARAQAQRHVLHPSVAGTANDPAVVAVEIEGKKASLALEQAADRPVRLGAIGWLQGSVVPPAARTTVRELKKAFGLNGYLFEDL